MPASSARPVVLVVLDGWGYRESREGNAIALANAPVWERLWERAPKTLLQASGLAVGLPNGQMGNSEVGHLNLGAGRVVQQDIVRISGSIESGAFFQLHALVEACRRARERNATLHLLGLLGDGGVHALDEHLFALIDMAERSAVPRVAIHCLMDGRDTLPTSGLGYMRELLARARGRARIASVGGRYYGMDRDKRWERTRSFYGVAVHGEGECETDPIAAIEKSYARGVTDEFMLPVVICDGTTPLAPMRDADEVVCFNFRADRMRQIVRALTDTPFDGFDDPVRPRVNVTTMTVYDRTSHLPVLFEPFSMARIMAEVVSGAGRSMFRTAETEKYQPLRCGRS